MRGDPASVWDEVAAAVAERFGLHFPRRRWSELQRGMAAAAVELGLADAECARRLLSAQLDPAQLGILASQLTVGETYFFRDRETFDALANEVLPALCRARPARRLRLWSAGCCSGEEPYSLAMLLHRVVPDLAEWDVHILATDLNPRFLQRAAAGVYGEWSFRGVPHGFRQQHFRRRGERFELAREIRRMVTFASLNLSDAAAWPAGAFDLILCRNVLMYFNAEQARRVVARLHGALAADAWLAVAPCEASHTLFAQFATPLAATAIYAKGPAAAAARSCVDGAAEAAAPTPTAPAALSARARGRGLGGTLLTSPNAPPAPSPTRPQPDPPQAAARDLPTLAQTLADQGRLREALAACDRWTGRDKLDARAHHLRALVLLELGEAAAARRALQRAVYLEPDRAMAHFALGHLERGAGRPALARRSWQTTLELLARHPPQAAIQHADGVDAQQLTAATQAALATAPAA